MPTGRAWATALASTMLDIGGLAAEHITTARLYQPQLHQHTGVVGLVT